MPEHKIPDSWKWDPEKTDEAYSISRLDFDTEPNRSDFVSTEFIRGGSATEVRLVSGPTNPYRDMWIHAHQTWGPPNKSIVERWELVTPKQRMEGIYHILTGQALPLSLELPDFYFEVMNAARHSFDQVARMRVGVTFGSGGTRDNDMADAPVLVPARIYDDPERRRVFEEAVNKTKIIYANLNDDGATWGDTRALLPQSVAHRFAVDINYMALRNFLGKRMRFCMDEFTVDIAWKMWRALGERYAVLAAPIRPECDFAQKCTYRAEGRPGEAYSNLYSGCQRWPDPNPRGEFACSSTTPEVESDYLGERHPLLFDGTYPVDWIEAFNKDLRYFDGTV